MRSGTERKNGDKAAASAKPAKKAGGRDARSRDRAKIYRVMFNEITQKAIKAAFEHPTQVNENLVDAQQARRVLDRLVGYKVSPILWDKVRRGLSAGRVQTVALRLIVERETRNPRVRPQGILDDSCAARRGPAAVV